MRKQIQNIFFVLILCCSAQSITQAQNDGYAGKRFLLKTDAVNGTRGVFSGLEIECVLARHTTVTVGGTFFSGKIGQKYSDSDYPDDAYYTPNDMRDKAKIQTIGGMIEVRQYLNLHRPAPYGAFAYFGVYAGTLDIKNGTYSRSMVEYRLDYADYAIPVKYTYQGIIYTVPELGMGYQVILKKKFSVGAKLGMNYTILNNSFEGAAEEAVKGVANTFGGNLYSASGVGVSGYLQVGYLIF